MYYVYISPKMPPLMSGPHPVTEFISQEHAGKFAPEGYELVSAWGILGNAVEEFEWYAKNYPHGVKMEDESEVKI